MPEQITIREAFPDEYPDIQALYQQMLGKLAEEHPETYRKEGAEVALKPQTFLDTLDDEDWTFLVADREGTIAGIVQLSIEEEEDSEYRFPQTIGWIEELIVAEGQPRAAIAAALIEGAEKWVQQQGATELHYVVYDFNEDMLAATKQLGFGTVSTRVSKKI